MLCGSLDETDRFVNLGSRSLMAANTFAASPRSSV
jgi:hypothetical protein